MAIMLLFLTNNEATRSVTNRTSHIIVISLILLSRTSGALLGYLAGFLHSKVLETKKYRLIRVTILLIAIFLIIALFAAIPRNTIEPIDKALKKIEAAEKNVNRILSGNKIDYYAMIESAGEDNTSGVWRLNQWNSILTLFVHSSLDKIFFGYGIGATRIFFMADAHNDYLRILFETGLVGLILNMTIWIILYRRMPLKFRSIVIMIAVFCITENNYDNFPAMSLLVFYMIGAGGAVCDHKNGTGFAVVNRLQAKRV